MEAFAPALFTQILKSILNTGMSKDRQDTQRKRGIFYSGAAYNSKP